MTVGPSYHIGIPYTDGRDERYWFLVDDHLLDKGIANEAEAIEFLDNDLDQDEEWDLPVLLDFDTRHWTCIKLTQEQAATVHWDANLG